MSKTNTRPSVTATLKKLEAKDPGLKRLIDKSYAYAVFPSVGKANLVVGGGYGRGEVFERGKRVGYATISQLTIGVQLGGDTFSEVIVFESKEAFERFKRGATAFAANASAVLVKAGAASAKNFEKGVAVYVYPEGGMLLELGMGGQRFKFKPADEQQQDEGGKKRGKGAQGRGGEEEGDEQDEGEGEQSEDDENEDEESGTGGGGNRALELAGRAVGGVRSAASKATAMVKRHPVAATVAGVGLAAGLGLLIARSFRGATGEQADDQGEEEQDQDPDAEEQDEGAQDSADDSDEDSAEDQEEQDGGEGEENDEENEGGGNRGVLSRLLSRGKSRA